MLATSDRTITYNYGDGLMVDIVTKRGGYEAWLYYEEHGDKHFMFGVPKNQNTYFEFYELIRDNVQNYIDLCN